MTDYGSECTFDLSWQVMENLKWKTRLWAYTTYKRAEIEWGENTITFQFNRYISSNISSLSSVPMMERSVRMIRAIGSLRSSCLIGFSYSF